MSLPSPNPDTISVIDVGIQLGKHKSSVFKVMRRLGIHPQKRRDADSKNQIVAYITHEELERIKGHLAARASVEPDDDGNGDVDGFVSAEIGVFYLVQLEPEHDPLRIKVGFAANMADRLQKLRCSAPFTAVLKTWPCKRLWEKTAIDSVTAGCERLHTEVFRCESLSAVADKCERFFALMPPPQ